MFKTNGKADCVGQKFVELVVNWNEFGTNFVINSAYCEFV